MKLIWIFALLVVVFYQTQDNETDALIARMIEGGANLAIDIGVKFIEIPIMKGGKIVWKCGSVPTKFAWNRAKIPLKMIIKLAWKFARKPLKLITPKFIEDAVRAEVEKYSLNTNLRKQ